MAATAAWADFQSFAIEQVYSNADGTVQYVVLHEAQGTNGGNNWSGRTFTSTHAGITKSFAFPADLPGTATANKRVLIGSQGLANLGFIAPDYVIPNGFLATDGGTLNFAAPIRSTTHRCRRTGSARSIVPAPPSPTSPPTSPARPCRCRRCR